MDSVSWHDKNSQNHSTLFIENSVHGYRIISLSVYGDPVAPLYACVMVRNPEVPAQVNLFSLSGTELFFQAIPDLTKEGYHPVLISATGPRATASFTAVFEKQGPATTVRSDMTPDHWQEWTEDALMKHSILRSVDAYGSSDDPRIVAVWTPNVLREAWACDAVDEDALPLQQRFNAMTSTAARAVRVAVTPSGRHIEMFADSQIGPCASRAGMNSEQYQANADALLGQGLRPISINGCTTATGNRYAAIFAKDINPIARVFRRNGPASIQAIDSAMETFMKAHDIRGTALAITEGARLVYTSGYTWAEPSYPDVQPTTFFRQASCSKILAAMGIYASFQYAGSPSQTLSSLFDQTMNSILQLRQPDGSPPVGRFNDITIRHLLESTSGLNNDLLWESGQAAQSVLPQSGLPATRAQLATFATMQPLPPAPGDPNNPAVPGDPNNAVYGNFGYFLLSEIVRKLEGVASFEEALGTLIFKPLELTRIRRSVSLIADQQADEARYHLSHYLSGVDPNPPLLWPLQCGSSLRSADQPLVAAQYGAWDMEMLSGAGGISAAVVDMARIAASFSLRNGNPIFSAKTLDAWFNMATAASQTLKGPDPHGYHGWDGTAIPDPVNHVYQASKGGYLPGHQTTVQFTTRGLGLVMAMNGNLRPGDTTDWFQPVMAASVAYDWGPVDLFPKYFKTALQPTLFQTPKQTVKQWPYPTDQAMELTRQSILPRLSKVVHDRAPLL